MTSRAAILYACLSVMTAATTLPPAAKTTVDFKKHVQPIFAEKCHSCHGSKQQQSGLRLDKRQNALRGGDYGPVIMPGKSAESKLILRLVNGDGGMQMPPTGALSAEEIGVLRAWIDQGAEFAEVDIKDEKPAKPVDPKLRSLISAVRAQDMSAIKKALSAQPAFAKGVDAADSSVLHHAAGFGNIASIKLLLAAGADGNAKNRFGATPLHWAIGDPAKISLLLANGADVNAQTTSGKTTLYLAASSANAHPVMRILLDKGAKADQADLGGRTPLMAAAGRGDSVALQMLLAKGADVNKRSGSGGAALYDAARSRNIAAVRLLIDKGADVNLGTKRNQTPLAQAAMQGSEDILRLLLDKGAKVNVQDERGYSPLMYAAYSESLNAVNVKLLLAKGADVRMTGEGETAKSLAAKRGDNEVARLLGVSDAQRATGGVAHDKGSAEDRPIPPAVQKALAVLEKQSPNFVKRGGCNSCHNQSLPSAAVATARQHGIAAPKQIMELSREMREISPERHMELSAAAVNSMGYEMLPLTLAKVPGDEYTEAVVHYMKMLQTPEGYWQTPANRPPLSLDDFITTAMAANTLRAYAPAAHKTDTDERLRRAARWLENSQPKTTQEHAFRTLGLMWAGASAAVIDRSAQALAATQRTDGGWSQLPTMGSDAYATGEALFALHVAGKMPTADAVYQRGVKYLLRTQAADGSWHVKTRSLPLQPYFESGFPYGHDQWISAAGTSWAAMALSLTVDAPRISQK